MKYVGKSSISTDKNNAATIKSSVQAAVADYQSTHASGDPTASFVIKGSEPTTGMGNAADQIKEVMNGDYPNTQSDSNGFTVTITSTGAVTVTCGALSK